MNGKDTLETAIADLLQKSFARRKLDAKIKEGQDMAAADSRLRGDFTVAGSITDRLPPKDEE